MERCDICGTGAVLYVVYSADGKEWQVCSSACEREVHERTSYDDEYYSMKSD